MFGLGGGMDPKKMQAMMRQLGMSQQEISASKVTIDKKDGSKIVIEDPSVARISFQGQESFQISGNTKEEAGESEFTISEEDIQTVVDKTGATKEQAKRTLEETRDLAEAIMKLSP